MDSTNSFSDRLSSCYSGAVYDVLHSRNHSNCVLPHALQPLNPAHRIAGPIYTVSGHVYEALDDHQTLLAWTRLLAEVPSGSVLICQPNDSTLAHMGELSAETMLLRGVRGYIVDGGCRDSAFILKIGFPVWCRYYTPRDIVGRWIVDGLGEPIAMGGITITTGDYVLADRDGAVVIPAEMAEEVTGLTEELMCTENKVRAAILSGVDPREAYLRHGKF